MSCSEQLLLETISMISTTFVLVRICIVLYPLIKMINSSHMLSVLFNENGTFYTFLFSTFHKSFFPSIFNSVMFEITAKVLLSLHITKQNLFVVMNRVSLSFAFEQQHAYLEVLPMSPYSSSEIDTNFLQFLSLFD